MMPSLAEVFFNCPLCDGPLIAWETDAGRETDCPHCLKSIAIPSAALEKVDKTTFCEPLGLRRILQEVRDSEWEVIRRKLQEARAKVAALETELRQTREQSALTAAKAIGQGSAAPGDFAALRQELTEVSARSEAAQKNFAVLRQQQEVAMDRLKEHLEVIRAEVGPLRAENAEMLQELTETQAALEAQQKENADLRQQLERRRARTGAQRLTGLAVPSAVERG